MTGSAHALAAPIAGTLTTVPATGALKLSWLLLVFPLFGAAVLLVGGRRAHAEWASAWCARGARAPSRPARR